MIHHMNRKENDCGCDLDGNPPVVCGEHYEAFLKAVEEQ